MTGTGGLVRRKSIVGANSQIPSNLIINIRHNNLIEKIRRWILLYAQLQLSISYIIIQETSPTTFQYRMGAN